MRCAGLRCFSLISTYGHFMTISKCHYNLYVLVFFMYVISSRCAYAHEHSNEMKWNSSCNIKYLSCSIVMMMMTTMTTTTTTTMSNKRQTHNTRWWRRFEEKNIVESFLVALRARAIYACNVMYLLRSSFAAVITKNDHSRFCCCCCCSWFLCFIRVRALVYAYNTWPAT